MSDEFSAMAPKPLTTIDWHKLARDAFGQGFVAGFIGGALHGIAQVVDAKTAQATREPGNETDDDAGNDDAEAVEAAATLGVAPTATEDEIRAALRARLASSRLHPDHGGDGVEASRLIAAKNLLIERARDAQASAP